MRFRPTPSLSPSWQAWLMILAVTLIWGSSFLMLKKALVVLRPDQVVAGRMSIAGLLFLPWALRKLGQVSAAQWWRLLLFALVANIGTSLSYAIAQSKIDSSLNGMLNTLTPLMTLGVGVVFFRQQARTLQVAGILLGLAGAGYLVFLAKDSQVGVVNAFALFAILATMGNGLMNNLIKFQLQDLRPTEVAAFTFFITLGPALVYWQMSGATEAVLSHPFGGYSLLFVALLALLGNGLALLLVARLVHLSSPLFASLTTYLIPIVALGWGLWDGEQILVEEVLAMLLISASVYLVNVPAKG